MSPFCVQSCLGFWIWFGDTTINFGPCAQSVVVLGFFRAVRNDFWLIGCWSLHIWRRRRWDHKCSIVYVLHEDSVIQVSVYVFWCVKERWRPDEGNGLDLLCRIRINLWGWFSWSRQLLLPFAQRDHSAFYWQKLGVIASVARVTNKKLEGIYPGRCHSLFFIW